MTTPDRLDEAAVREIDDFALDQAERTMIERDPDICYPRVEAEAIIRAYLSALPQDDAITRLQAENADLRAGKSTLHRRLQALESPRRVAALGARITMQDVRLCAGEGRLSAATVLQAVNAILRNRAAHLHGGDHERG